MYLIPSRNHQLSLVAMAITVDNPFSQANRSIVLPCFPLGPTWHHLVAPSERWCVPRSTTRAYQARKSGAFSRDLVKTRNS